MLEIVESNGPALDRHHPTSQMFNYNFVKIAVEIEIS